MGSEPGLRHHVQRLEQGSDYAVFLLFLEMPGAHHQGFMVQHGSTRIAKGVVASHVRSLNIENVEMVVAPPSGSNAILMTRVRGPTPGETLDRIAREALSYLDAQGFFSHPS